MKDYHLPHLDLTTLVPQNLRNPMLTSLVDNLFNRFLTKDEAVPLYGYVGRKPAATDDWTPKIPQQSVERDINALVPVLSFTVGSETHSFTVQDLVQKAKVLGVSADQSTWLYSQGNNYSPPIDLDKFTNFFNWYWVAGAMSPLPIHASNPKLAPEYYTISRAQVGANNDWQNSNHWVHRSALASARVNLSKIIQAVRPIIEYQSDIPLNSRIDPQGRPSDTGALYTQHKTEFNQAPLFDLYRYDGTHANLTSALFFYSEDPTADIDIALQRRVAQSTNSSSDFLFEHGLHDGQNTLLFFKRSTGKLCTIWHPGYFSAQVVDQVFNGTGNGVLTASTIDPTNAQQVWTLTATSGTTFSISASKLKVIPAPFDVVTVATEYSNNLLDIAITSGSVPFSIGDTFTLRVGNFETTRYVTRDQTDAVYDQFGGEAQDVNKTGAWQIPRMFYTNVAAENNAQLPEGVLYSHFRGILANQLVGLPEDRAFGGSVKLWSEQQNLLASLLMQRDLTPTSIIDLAQRQYETGMNTVVDLYFTHALQYMSDNEVLVSSASTDKLLDFLLSIRAKDQDVRTVLYDSTSPVLGFPATLPQLGITPLVQPGLIFDAELGVELLRAHDGHLMPLSVFTQSFRDRLLSPGALVKRSTGVFAPAISSFTATPSRAPFKGELWFYLNELKAFNVLSDGAIAPTATALGQFWYNRAAGLLYKWQGAWVPELNMLAPWVHIDFAQVLNDLQYLIEQRLYNGIDGNIREYFTTGTARTALSSNLAGQLKRELGTWAATNGYDPTAPDYVSTNAFTWNYSSLPPGSVPGVTGDTPARWYNTLQAHQSSVAGVIVTSRPNLEPWKLLGFSAKPVYWAARYGATITPAMIAAGGYTTGLAVRAVKYSALASTTVLSGLPTIDGLALQAGQYILLVSEVAQANNGIWSVQSGAWTRTDAAVLLKNTMFTVTDGLSLSGTQWVLTGTPSTINIDPIQFEQVRLWKQVMWTDIQAARATLKLSVDIQHDTLLPPYVSPVFLNSVNALSTVMPSLPAKAYNFGEGSPVETVWTKSIEYRYSLARALFRQDPLAFLGHCWGFEWVEVDGILYDGFSVSVPGHPRFRLHGDQVSEQARVQPISFTSCTSTSAIDIKITRTGYTATRAQSFTITANGGFIGYINENQTLTINASNFTLSNLLIADEGKPFRLGDSFHITADANGLNAVTVFKPISYAIFNGLAQTFTQALRASSIDTNQGYAVQAYKGWDVNLGYRAGGLVSTDDLRIFNDSETLPESAYSLRVKRSMYTKDLWVQGLRVSVVQLGSNKPSDVQGFIPINDASDWTFRIDGYNARYLSLTKFGTELTGEVTTFNALNSVHTDRQWAHGLSTKVEQTVTLPQTIIGLQNVLNFLFSYADYLAAQGWKFNDDGIQNIDAETGRVRNWQLEIEKLVDRVYAGIELGQGHVINPFMDRIWLEQDTGLLSKFFDTSLFDVTGHPAVFDTLGNKISTTDLTILRTRDKSQISANVPMFSVHAQLDEYEHLFVFSNMSAASTNEGLIYDPFSGARIATIKLNGRRQASKTMRPEFGGHYLVGNEVKRNLQASADKIAGYYDPDHAFEDKQSSKHALALLGFTPKQYMANLDLTERTQFNFWRGLVQMKGTNSSVDAFLNNDRFQNATIDEYWAYKVAEYGDSRSKVFPELKLNVTDTLQQFTKLIFDPVTIPTGFEAFSVIDRDDEQRWFTLDDLGAETNQFAAQVVGTFNETTTAGQLITLPFMADQLVGYTEGIDAIQVNNCTLQALGTSLSITGYGPATPKFNPVKLFNYVDAELIDEIPLWHPANNQHTPTAIENINSASVNDPARYNVSTQVIGNINFDPLHIWGAKELGRVWWDTTNLAYVPYYDAQIYPSVEERLSRWGTLTDFATIDVAEWVESTVTPAMYNAQSALDAGSTELTTSKADGTVHGAKTYSRNRLWMARPIAWSLAGVAVQAAHPSFNGSYNTVLNLNSDSLMWLEEGTFADYGIQAGMRIGGWEQTTAVTRPISEYLVKDSFTKQIQGIQASNVQLISVKYTAVVGEFRFEVQNTATPILDSAGVVTATDNTSFLTMVEVQTGLADVALIRQDRTASFTLSTAQVFNYDFQEFGLRVVLTLAPGTYASADPAAMISTALMGVQVFDAVQVTAVVPGIEVSFVNNDPTVVGWRAWNVPTQVELDADSQVPNSAWFAYTGAYRSIAATIGAVKEAAAGKELILNSGLTINRYLSTWSTWIELKTDTLSSVAVTAGAVTFNTVKSTTAEYISVYVNGVARLRGTYTLTGTVLTVLGVSAGSMVVAIIRAYSPTAVELKFNPDVLDNLLIQTQYKVDYQYVSIPVRDSDGNISTTKYFFWVKNRSTAALKKKLSVKAITQLLVTGPSQYLTFQSISQVAPFVYSAITVSGLSYIVTKDDTFKLRFTRNFTLRDDPHELDLKDTHVEWALIRSGQRTRIPEQLWSKLVQTACAQDAAGNALPSPRRTSYDARNGTSTRFGFGADQVLAPTELILSTLLFTILNTALVDTSGAISTPSYISVLDFTRSDAFFSTPANTRETLTKIWNGAKVEQINELFFAVLNDICAANFQLTDLFKTSRLSAQSTKIMTSPLVTLAYE